MNAPVSFYQQPPQRAIEQLVQPALSVQPATPPAARAFEAAVLQKPPPGGGEVDRRTLQAPSAAFQRALDAAAHPAALGRDMRALRRLFLTVRRRGLHAALKDAFWRDEAPDGAEDLLARAVRERPALSERAVVTDLVRLADARSADPVRRFVFLMEAEQRARQRNLPGTVEARLGAAAEQVWALHRPAIERAFFDQARALVDEVEHGHAWVEFRGLYFDWVVRAGKVDEVFAVLLAEFGPAQLMAGVRHLRDALVADLRSEVVCRDLERMRQQQMDLEVNRLVWSLLNDATAFLAHERAGTPPSPDEVARLCQEVLGYAAGTPTERKLAAICRLVADEASGAVRTRVAAFMKRLPMGIWSSHEARHTLLPAMFAAAPR